MIALIIGPTGNVHYRRPVDDPLVDEARRTPGYSVRIAGEKCPACDAGVPLTRNGRHHLGFAGKRHYKCREAEN